MIFNRFVFVGILTLALVSSPARADDHSPDASATLAALKEQYKAANAKYREERKAKGTANEAVQSEDAPYTAFAPRFLKFAEDRPDSPEALDALNLALQTGFFSREGSNGTWDSALRLIRERYVADPAVKRVYLWLSVASGDPASEAVLREILAKNPDRDTRGAAAQCLEKRVERVAQFAEKLRSHPESLKSYEDREGKAKLEEMLAKGDRARSEADALKDSFRVDYADFFPIIAIGQTAPEVASQDANGNEVRLSDLKGKVVVLDIWATWCLPCRAMIPHEREMVGRLKDRPFALVSISCDEEKSALTDFLAKEPMPWAQWWNGPTGGISSAWDIRSYPTIYVLDATGVIRHKNLRGDELEKAVGELLGEQATPAAKP